jgi:hypothetical protein
VPACNLSKIHPIWAKKKQTITISEIRVNHSAITKFISLHIFGYIVKHNLLIWVLIL